MRFNTKILILIVLLGAVVRVFKLSDVPPGVSHDELEYINNGYSIFATGRDLYGDFLPLTVGGVGYVAIPAYIAGISTSLFGLSETAARLPSVLFGVIEILLVYGICQKIFKNEKVSIFSAFALSLSNWGIKMSRVMFDPPVALFFFLLGIYLFLSAKNLRIVTLGLVALCLGTLSYYGALFVSPFVFIALIIYRWNFIKEDKAKFLLRLAAVLGVMFVILGIMLFRPRETSRSSGRSSELLIFDKAKISASVDFERSHSTGPRFLDEIFVNKATYLLKTFAANYLEAFSPTMIFVEGDPNVIYGLWGRGELKLVSFPLVILGMFYFHKKSKRGLVFVGSMIFIAPITSGLSGPVYATRAFLLWPFLLILVGGGLTALWEWKRKIFTLYLAGFLFFTGASMYQYFYRYPTYAKEAWFDSEKQLAIYLSGHRSESTKIYSLEARQAFMEYVFFGKLDPSMVQNSLNKNEIKGNIAFGEFEFVYGCPDSGTITKKTIIHEACGIFDGYSNEIRTREGNNSVKWAIYDIQK